MPPGRIGWGLIGTAIVGALSIGGYKLNAAGYDSGSKSRDTEVAELKAKLAPSEPAPVSSLNDPFPIYPLQVLQTPLKARLSLDPSGEWQERGEKKYSGPVKKRGIFIPCAETGLRDSRPPRTYIVYLPDERSQEKFGNKVLNFYRMGDPDATLTLDINVTDARQAFHYNPRDSPNFYPVEMKPRIIVSIPGLSGNTPIVAVYDDKWLAVNQDIDVNSIADALGIRELESGPIPGRSSRARPAPAAPLTPSHSDPRYDREAYTLFTKVLKEVEKMHAPEDIQKMLLTLYTWAYTEYDSSGREVLGEAPGRLMEIRKEALGRYRDAIEKMKEMVEKDARGGRPAPAPVR